MTDYTWSIRNAENLRCQKHSETIIKFETNKEEIASVSNYDVARIVPLRLYAAKVKKNIYK